MGKDSLDHRFFWLPENDGKRKNGDYFQGVPLDREETKLIPFSNLWDYEKQFNQCSNEGGVIFRHGKKPITFIQHVFVLAGVSINLNSCILDYFAGSGTTGHAVINLNREDEGKRKYILVEMAEYFDMVTRPRIEKVIYSDSWKDGKPISRKGSSHIMKYIRLESYEDTLNNITLDKTKMLQLGAVNEEYLLSYMLDIEAKESASLLNIARFKHPFEYSMAITQKLETTMKNIDLVESFNYLIGLQVEHSYAMSSFDADFATSDTGALSAKLKNGTIYTIKMIEGQDLSGETILIIWRNMTDDTNKDNAVLDAFFNKKKISATEFEYKKIYVNCDNNLQNMCDSNETWKVILIEEEMKKRMFEGA